MNIFSFIAAKSANNIQCKQLSFELLDLIVTVFKCEGLSRQKICNKINLKIKFVFARRIILNNKYIDRHTAHTLNNNKKNCLR